MDKVDYVLHWVAIAWAMPWKVKLRSFALVGLGAIFQMRCSRPSTMLVGWRFLIAARLTWQACRAHCFALPAEDGAIQQWSGRVFSWRC